MEGAVRLFAGEFSASTLVVPDGDDPGAVRVVTPAGAYCGPVFLAGVLTEFSETGESLHARLADPTGGFDLTCSGRNVKVSEMFRSLPRPSFISLTGRAHAFRQGGGLILTIRPDHVQSVDRQVRDQWVLVTAGAMLARLKTVQACMAGAPADDRVSAVIRHYHLSPSRLDELAAMAQNAAESVSVPKTAESGQPDVKELVIGLLKAQPGPRGVAVQEIIDTLGAQGIFQDLVLKAIEGLIVDDECYQPQKGYIRLL